MSELNVNGGRKGLGMSSRGKPEQRPGRQPDVECAGDSHRYAGAQEDSNFLRQIMR